MRQVSVTLLGVAAILVAACRGPGRRQEPSSPSPTAGTVVVVPKGPWVYRSTARQQAFLVSQHAVVRIRRDTVVGIDTVLSSADVVFSALAEGVGFDGTLIAYRIREAGHAFATPGGISLPLTFSVGNSGPGGAFSFTKPDLLVTCGSATLAALQSLQDLWFRIPDTLRLGSTWEDSTTYVMCRDGIPFRVSAKRSYRAIDVAEGGGRLTLILERTSQSKFEGEALRGGELVKLTGSASGSLMYELDPVQGILVGARGSSTADFTLRSRLRTQEARQENEIQISPKSIDKP